MPYSTFDVSVRARRTYLQTTKTDEEKWRIKWARMICDALLVDGSEENKMNDSKVFYCCSMLLLLLLVPLDR